MDEPICKLTLVYPLAAEDQILDIVLGNERIVKGFTTWRAEGHGEAFDAASTHERVRGRIDRGILVTVVARSALSDLLEIMRATAVPRLAFWVEPVDQFGHLA
jgi:hypothetical protein